MNEGTKLPDPPVQIRWNRVSTLTEGVKVFIGGSLKLKDNRLNFDCSNENRLDIIFYNCSEDELTNELILAARNRNEYWNSLTPISLVIGAMALIYIAASLLDRPAFRYNVIAALVAIFIPVFPVIPPGLLFTAGWHRLTFYARKSRAYRDIERIKKSDAHDHILSIKAYAAEFLAWVFMFAGICVNLFFIFLILSLLE